MRSKILENQVRSGQLSSGHVFGQQATSPPLVWKGRGTQRHSRMCPPPQNDRPQHLIEAAKRGRLDQMLFSAPLTTRMLPTTVRRLSDDRPPAVRWPSDGRPTTVRRPTIEKTKRKKLGEFFHPYVSSRTFRVW